jgi:type I restriction enzyme, S subunit
MWKTVKLGDVCELIGGGTPSKKNAAYYGGDIPWATVRDMHSDELSKTEHRITELGLENSSSKVIPANNIVIASRVGLGKVCLLNQSTAINQDLRGVIPKQPSTINVRYLFYWFKNTAQTIISAGRGATVHGVTLPFLKALEMPLPPLAEQQRIVAKLDAAFAEIDRAIDATTLAIEQAKIGLGNLIDGKTANRDDWSEYKVSDLGLVQTGNTPKTFEKDNYGNDIAFVKPPHFRTNGTLELVEDGLSATGAKSSRKASANSVMMVCIGATIGKVAVCHEEVCFNQQINSLSPAEEYDAELIYWQMRGARFQRDVRERAGQATLPIISKAKWANLNIYLPSSAEAQVQIRNQLRRLSDKTEEYCSFKASKIGTLQQLKSAILAQELQPSQSEAA